MLYPYAKKVLKLKLAVIEEIKMLSGSYRGLVKVGGELSSRKLHTSRPYIRLSI
jgi:hypothetical protein